MQFQNKWRDRAHLSLEQLETRRLLAGESSPLSEDVAAAISPPTPPATFLVTSFRNPAPNGSLARATFFNGSIDSPGSTENSSYILENNQLISLEIDADASLQLQVRIIDFQSNVFGQASANSAGEPVLLNSVPVSAGFYIVEISGLNQTVGSFEGTLSIDSSFEEEAQGVGNNNTPLVAQDLDPTFITIGGNSGISHVLGSRSPEIEESFEAESLDQNWQISSSDLMGRIRISSEAIPSDGSQFLLMDRTSTGDNLNEAIWSVDLSNVAASKLHFAHASFNDEVHPLPNSFTGSANGDGVSISDDGNQWHTVLNSPQTPNGEWNETTVDLPALANSIGLDISGNLQIKFQQFGNGSFADDGRGYDAIRIETAPPVIQNDWYVFTLDDGEYASVALANEGLSTGATLELYSGVGTLIATGDSSNGIEQRIDDFRDYTTNGVADRYFVRVENPPTEYGILTTKQISYERESNSSIPFAQEISNTGAALGTVDDAVGSSLNLLSVIDGPETRHTPGDPILAVGPSQVVVALNSELAIFDKETGLEIFNQEMASTEGFFGSVGATQAVIDPWLIYDRDSERFFLVGIDAISETEEAHLYFAVSKDSTPTNGDDWHKYGFDFAHDPEPLGLGTRNHFADYEKIAATSEAIFVSGNYAPVNQGTGRYAGITAFDKNALVNGAPISILHQEFFEGFSVFPLHNHQPGTTQYFAESIGNSSVRVHAIVDVTTNPTRHTFDLPVPTFGEPADVPQLGGGMPGDSLNSRIMSGVVRDDSSWFTHAVTDPSIGDGETLTRWYQVAINDFPNGSPTLVQTGNADPGPGLYAWMPAIAVDGNQNVGIGFSMGGPSTYFGAAITGRRADDPVGQTILPPLEFAPGLGAYEQPDTSGRNRWGDYSGLVVDPVDDETFWAFNKFADETGRWDTKIVWFQIEPGPDADFYSFQANLGDQLSISTNTPFDSLGVIVNSPDVDLELYDPAGNLIASDIDSGDDGRNARIMHTVTNAGGYNVKVAPRNGQGTYTLTVDGANGVTPNPIIIASSPGDGALINEFPATYTVVADKNIDVRSVAPNELRVNNVPATGVTVQGSSLIFELDPATNVGDGQFIVGLAAGSILDLQGNSLAESFAGAFELDTVAMRVLSTDWNGAPLPDDNVLTPGPLVFTATLSELPAQLISGRRGIQIPGSDDVTLRNVDTDEIIDETSVSIDSSRNAFIATYGSLPVGNYTLTLSSGPGAFEDEAGNPLDGESNVLTNDGTPSGDGSPGGDFVVAFSVQEPVTSGDLFERNGPLGSLISTAEQSGALGGPTDQNAIRFFAQSGELVSVIAEIDDGVIGTLELVGLGGADSAAPGVDVRFGPISIQTDGEYELRISADQASNYDLRIFKNAAVEELSGDTSSGQALNIGNSFIELGSGRYALLGLSTPLLEFTHSNNPSLFHDISQTGTPLNLTDDSETTILTSIGNAALPAGHVTIGNNGGILAGDNVNLLFRNLPLPATGIQTGLLPFWDDLFDSKDNVYVQETTIDGFDTLVVQWEQMPHVQDKDNPGTDGDVTFQIQVFEEGAASVARFVYEDVFFDLPIIDQGADATIGYQDASGSFAQFSAFEPSLSNGDVLDLAALPDIDEYTIDLSNAVGKSLDVVLRGESGTDFSGQSLEVVNPDGLVVATAVADPLGADSSNVDLAILGFEPTNVGSNVYTLRVTSLTEGEYGIVVSESIRYEIEPNQPSDSLISIQDDMSMMGYLDSADGSDYVSVALGLGVNLVVRTSTPFDNGQNDPTNSLDPRIRILDSTGTTELASDSNSVDGKNAILTFTPTAQGVYLIEISAENGGQGEYVASYDVQTTVSSIDFGDAPSSFGVQLGDGGARHAAIGPTLGAFRDSENDGQSSSDASGDDLDGFDDEDGIVSSVYAVGQTQANINVDVQNAPLGGAFLNAWIDFDGNRNWSESEQIAMDLSVSNGANVLSFDVPANAVIGNLPARFRISSLPGVSVNGLAVDGEVEDHLIQVVEPPSLTIDDVSLSEGNNGATSFTFTVSRSHNFNDVQVDVSTLSDSAIAGEDFSDLNLTLTMVANGPQSQVVSVQVNGDNQFESDETFFVKLANANGATISDDTGVGTIQNDDPEGALPAISSVRVGSSSWSSLFVNFVDAAQQLGYRIPNGPDQLQTVSWVNMDRIYIQFTEDVVISQSDIGLFGVNVANYQSMISGFSYNAATAVATVELSTPLASDKLLLRVNDTVTDRAGNRLDGEWNNATTTGVSGNGIAGGNFDFRFNSLPGDRDHSTIVSSADAASFINLRFESVGSANYDIFADMDGSGIITSADVTLALLRRFEFLPFDEPVAVATAIAAIVDEDEFSF